ncbi:MAG: aminotransferase class V-fold PLP-dependent enzyme [Chloroflexia bacterium]|nr:aminotransferase class V-fold PLP-dependent enzyme [Chloroflexia bacterium]
MYIAGYPNEPNSVPCERPEDLRTYFLLDDDVVFLNHGSFGACPRPVVETHLAWQRQLERQPVEFVMRRTAPLLDAARSQLASFVNVQPTDLAFVVNATSGLNVVARSLALGPGDEILTTDLEYGALDFTWTHLCRKAGASYVNQHIPVPFTTPEAIVDALWEGVTHRTRAIFLSHITSATAVILPIEAICARARAEGILTIVDGAHAPGQIPLDLTGLDVDIYAGNCHKWLCGPKGSAFLYVRPEHQEWIESLTISWGWREGHTFLTRNQEQGTRDIAAFLAVPRAIDFLTEHEWPAVQQRCHQRLAALRERLHRELGTDPLYPNDEQWFSQMAVIALPQEPVVDPAELQRRLLHDHEIEVPCTRHEHQGFVRVSVQGYTTDDDLEVLESALIALCA